MKLYVAWPKDLTPCCAPEKHALAAKLRHLAAVGVAVVAVTPTASAQHQAYVERFKLDYALLLDPQYERLASFGWVEERTVRGKRYRHVELAAALVAPDGSIVRTYRPFDLEHDLLQVLRDVP